jgi:tripartite-type tricarboxylate transporter receptor subunit TctC
MIIPYPSGGSTDIMGRTLAQRLSQNMGQQVIVDNRAGASGIIGTNLAIQAPPDGYTILMVTIPLVINPSLYSKHTFDVIGDLAPVSLVASAPFVLVVHPSLPANSVKELIALAKKQPNKLDFPSGGNGTNSHVALELFKYLTGTEMVHVPYKGGGPALIALLGGEVDLGVIGIEVVAPHMPTGKLRALAITGKTRSAMLPGLPTVAEAGVPDYEFSSWNGVLAPAKTPAPIIATLNQHIAKAMRAPDLAERFAKEGTEVIASTPAQFAAHIKSELQRWGKVVKEMGLKGD